ncbi:MAG TPA: acyl carrier protein [Verrucomicrobiota bacterium]|nr:acyl carrier protein [Verrucomicrobiota bacterium]HRZ35388.1 acyl carrier protein [Candidatus Paceibacterota bacterium]HRZ54246.1 acyl carrier protein [Candidatus Paceibacterota bacterium]
MNSILSAETITKVQEILVRQLAVERAQVVPEADLVADLGADSLDLVEIGITAEETFNLTMPDEAMEKVRTVGDFYEALAARLELEGRPA